MGEFLSFLLTAFLIIYIVRILARIFLPMLFQNLMNKAQQQHQQRQNYGQHNNYNANRQNYNTNSQSGKVKVDYMPEPKKGSVKDSEGEFIDFEEIK
jgi:hypothetical protein